MSQVRPPVHSTPLHTQVARVVMLAWGTANRSKEENAKREARRLKPQ